MTNEHEEVADLPPRERTQRDHNGAVLRAARELLHATRVLVREEPEATAAWEALDRAIGARDDFMAALVCADGDA